MQRKLLPAGRALFGLLLGLLFLTATGAGQSFPALSSQAIQVENGQVEKGQVEKGQVEIGQVENGQVGELLRRGRQLEVQSRWGEALAHYEDAVRRFPGEETFRLRFNSARLHYDLGRRYSDSSFRDLVSRLSLAESLDLYDEVLLKIQSHYVELTSWKELLERGTNSLEVALSQPAFRADRLRNIDTAAIDDFRRMLRRELGYRVIRTRRDAKDAVQRVALLGEQRMAIRPSAVVLEYICGATNGLDPYSAYLTPSQLTDVYSQIEGNFVGLGIELKAAEGTLLIVRVIAGSPAQRADIRGGDRILSVDGQSTENLTTDQAANLLQGPAGSVVTLALVTAGEAPRQVTVRRERVDVPSVEEVQILDQDRGIAYLKLTCFQKTTLRDLDTALWKLHRQGMRSLLIDLRGNPGGLLVTAVDVADKFLSGGIIVSTRGRNIQEDQTYSAHEIGTWPLPLVVLIDKDSASAAEIFAGAIRDHQRGTVVGTRSYGKGSVQGIFPLNQGEAGVRLTTARFYSPSGRPYQHVGVEPDVLVQPHRTARPIDGSVAPLPGENADDPLLVAATQAARRLMTQH